MSPPDFRTAAGPYDVFNGDADGICALHQLRLAEPLPEAELITGVKRDIALLAKIRQVRDSRITVLDVSMDSNSIYLRELLASENEVLYIDHHFAGDIPDSPRLTHHIDPAPDQCTSLLVDKLLAGRFRLWAICGAFGDNLHVAATRAAASLSLSEKELLKLREVGELLNYNGYGSQLQDLYFPPDQLYRIIRDYQSPLVFHEQSQTMKTLKIGFSSDMELAQSLPEVDIRGNNQIYRFPDSPWARRISGVFANLKARENPAGAHALITENHDGTLRISLRAPLARQRDADTLCRAFPTGGGRAAAAGINALPAELLPDFLNQFDTIYH